MDFNAPVDQHGNHSSKWDRIETLYGVPPEDGIAMWTAVGDYPTAPCIRASVQAAIDNGIFGYSYEYPDYFAAIAWWMKTRHNWQIETDWILTAHGLGNAIALSMDVWSDPGDPVAIFTPVYHEFAIKIKKAGRVVTECPMALTNGRYELDLDDAQSRLTGREKILLWCSPQNPSGRVWTADELRAVSDFAGRNGMLLVADEIHHDLIYPGSTFVPMDIAAPEARDRTVYLTSASKTFNIPGLRTGNLIIPDPTLRAAMNNRIRALDAWPNSMGLRMIEAAYSPKGAAWADAQIVHLDKIRRLFDDGINAIPGLWSMPLASTYLGWVDFSGTGMGKAEIETRVQKTARIAAAHGDTFGSGHDHWMRFTLATQQSTIEEVVSRMQDAFADLQ